jgi:hypothetical protein
MHVHGMSQHLSVIFPDELQAFRTGDCGSACSMKYRKNWNSRAERHTGAPSHVTSARRGSAPYRQFQNNQYDDQLYDSFVIFIFSYLILVNPKLNARVHISFKFTERSGASPRTLVLAAAT